MKKLLLAILLASFSYAQSYTFIVKKYDKEIELESKIIGEIANSSVKNKVILYIPKITEIEKKVYSKYFTIGKTCAESNFIFEKKNVDEVQCGIKNKLFFTNNYKKLLSDTKYFGAFFWSKSRPNIVFVENRLAKYNISLPSSYKQFIEDL